jgi:hypothetical protein
MSFWKVCLSTSCLVKREGSSLIVKPSSFYAATYVLAVSEPVWCIASTPMTCVAKASLMSLTLVKLLSLNLGRHGGVRETPLRYHEPCLNRRICEGTVKVSFVFHLYGTTCARLNKTPAPDLHYAVFVVRPLLPPPLLVTKTPFATGFCFTVAWNTPLP